MTLQIRSCNPGDFTSIFVLFGQLWPDLKLDENALHSVYTRALSSGTQHLIVGVLNDRIVGFCSLSVKNNFWKAGCIGNVDELVVDKNHRGQGIGKKLMRRIEEIAISNQCKQIELDSAFHRKEAHLFYENIGFKSRAYLFTKPLIKVS
jgi:glucosamine-phosphate N-acetyltransferase